jgi:hypothetical protein
MQSNDVEVVNCARLCSYDCNKYLVNKGIWLKPVFRALQKQTVIHVHLHGKYRPMQLFGAAMAATPILATCSGLD